MVRGSNLVYIFGTTGLIQISSWRFRRLEVLNKAAGRNNFSIFEFIIILQKEQTKIEDDMKLLQSGKQMKVIHNK